MVKEMLSDIETLTKETVVAGTSTGNVAGYETPLGEPVKRKLKDEED